MRITPTVDDVKRMSDEELVDAFASACSIGNEMNNNAEISALRAQLLFRLEKGRTK